MAASYPGAVKTFTTKAAGGAILAAHVNDLQDEVVAIETQLGVNAGAKQTWTPTVTWTGGSADYTTFNKIVANYYTIGKLVFINMTYQLVTIGSGNRTMAAFTLPAALSVSPSSAICAVESLRQTAFVPRAARAFSTSNSVEFYLGDGATLSGYVVISGFYESP